MNQKELLQYCKDNAADAHIKMIQAGTPETKPEANSQASGQPELNDLSDRESVAADRAAINRANAQYSTGPKTDLGKRHSSLNAVKTALTGRTVLLESDDVEVYEAHLRGWFGELKPEGLHETALAQSIADSYWRNDRIVTIEAAIFARGRINHRWESMNAYEKDVAGDTEITVLTDAQLNTIHERELRNLHIQENRLRRQREYDLKLLWTLQAARREAALIAEARAKTESAHITQEEMEDIKRKSPKPSTTQPTAGFVFSTSKTSKTRRARITLKQRMDRSARRKQARKSNRKAA